MQTDGLASLLAIGLNGPALRHTLLRALITVIGPSGLRTLSLARTNIRNAAAGAGKQAVRIGSHQRKLEGDCGEEKSMVVNLKFPASRHAIPPQCKTGVWRTSGSSGDPKAGSAAANRHS